VQIIVKEVQIKTTTNKECKSAFDKSPGLDFLLLYTPLHLSNFVSFLEENHFVQLPHCGCCNFSDPVDRRVVLNSTSEVGSTESAVLVTNIKNTLEKAVEGF